MNSTAGFLPGHQVELEALAEAIAKGHLQGKSKATSFTIGKLREHQPLLDNKDTYDFNLRTKANALTVEELVDRNDLFAILAWRVGLAKFETAKPGRVRTVTWPNPALFTSPATLAADLDTVYNGKVSVQENQRETFATYPMESFRHVPESLGGEFLGVDDGSADVNRNLLNTQGVYGDGFFVLPRQFRPVIDGNQDPRVRVQIPAFSGITLATDEAGFVTHLVFEAIGILVKGVNRNN